MSDITKCTDRHCPSRKTCWRYIAPSSRPQSYGHFDRADNQDKCQDYWKAEPKAKPSEQRKCFHYSNFQPLKAEDNWSKNSMYNGVFIRRKAAHPPPYVLTSFLKNRPVAGDHDRRLKP